MKLSGLSCCFMLLTAASSLPSHAQGALVCEFQVPAIPPDWTPGIRQIEIDRVSKSARPGFQREWAIAGMRQGVPWGELVVRFDTVADAAAFSTWLDGFQLPGDSTFWDRPSFALGHRCRVMEVLGDEDRPSTEDTQATLREERFSVAPGTPASELRAWFEQVRQASHRRGDTSVMLLYSEPEGVASLLSFGAVPAPQRALMAAPPIASRPAYVSSAPLDWSAWTMAILFPFEPGDHGRPSLWPLPGIEPYRGDGLCEVSRHESFHDTADCLPTCGNAVADPGETPFNCPGDVPVP